MSNITVRDAIHRVYIYIYPLFIIRNIEKKRLRRALKIEKKKRDLNVEFQRFNSGKNVLSSNKHRNTVNVKKQI